MRTALLLLFGSCLTCLPAAAAEARSRPSILLILADDLGSGDLGCYGAPDMRTPHVDRLAREGVRFTQFYANGPECTPTRAALLSGRYPHRVGGLECAIGIGNVGRYDDADRLAKQHDLGLPADRSVLARGLRGAGYRTALIGKWHLGYEARFHPHRHGFERFFGILGGNADYFRHVELSPLPIFYDEDRPIQRDGYLTHLLADEAIRYLEAPKRGQPFFLYLALTTPHSPYQGPGDAQVPITEANFEKGTRAKYVEMVEDMDRQVGRVLEALERQGLAGDTVVLFASDNGGTRLGRNAPLAGYKGTTYEGGIRVPCVVRWPGRIRPGTVSAQVGITMDLTASLLHLAGAAVPPEQPLDGMDLLGHVAAGRPDLPRTLFWRGRRGERTWKAVRDGSLKLVQRQDGTARDEWLYDLARDPGEQQDLKSTQPGEAARLGQRLAAWEQEVRPAR